MPSTSRVLSLLLAAVLVGGLGVAVAERPAAASASGVCALGGPASDSRLANFSGYVVNAASGATVYSKRGTTPRSTGSVLKLLTAAAALRVLGPSYRMTTKVVAGPTKGTVVLVGGGDPTLSRVSNGYYAGAPRLSELAKQVHASLGTTKITTIIVDASLWSTKDRWDSSWKRSEQKTGYLSEVTALQVDGDRANPRASVSPRSTHPVTNAGRYFAKALGVPDAKIVTGRAVTGAKKLGAVKSQPISKLVSTMLLTSDGTLAESIARVTSKVAGGNGSAKSLQKVVTTALSGYGLDPAHVVIRDGSGLSTKNTVSPAFVTRLLRTVRVAKGDLKYVYRGLSVAGRTGSLVSRFTGANAVARGHLRAKTGWLDTEYSLAGIVRAKDGTKLVFAFYAIGPHVQPSARMALDTLAARLYTCGARL